MIRNPHDAKVQKAKKKHDPKKSSSMRVTSPLKHVSHAAPKSVKTKSIGTSGTSPLQRTLSCPVRPLVRAVKNLILSETDIEASKREAIEAAERHNRTTLLCDMRVQRLVREAAVSSTEVQEVRKQLETAQHVVQARDEENEDLHKKLEELEISSHGRIAELELHAQRGADSVKDACRIATPKEVPEAEGIVESTSLHSPVTRSQSLQSGSPSLKRKESKKEMHDRTLSFNLDISRVPSSQGSPTSSSPFSFKPLTSGMTASSGNHSILGLRKARVHSIAVMRRMSMATDVKHVPFRTPRGVTKSSLRSDIKAAITKEQQEQSGELTLELHDQFPFAIECGMLELVSGLKSLRLEKAELTNTELQILRDELASCHITKFEYTNSKVPPNTVEVFSKLLQSMRRLVVLSFAGTCFEGDAEQLATGIGSLGCLTKLALAKCSLTDWDPVISELSNNQYLSSVDLRGTHLSTRALQYLALLIKVKPSLTHVDLVGAHAGKDHTAMTWLMDSTRARHVQCEDTLHEICKVYVHEGPRGSIISLDDGWSPLHYAVFLGDLEKVEGLLEDNYKDIVKRDALGRTPLHLACMANTSACLDILIQGLRDRDEGKVVGVLNYADDFGMSALQAAVDRCHLPCLTALIEAGATVDSYALESAIKMQMDYNKCVQADSATPVAAAILETPELQHITNHRGCPKARRAVKQQLSLLSAYAHMPLRSVALRAFLPGFLVYIFVLAIITMTAASFSTHLSSHDFLSTKSLRDRMEGIESLHNITESSLPDIHHLSTIPELWEWSDIVLISIIEDAIHSKDLDVVGGVRLRQVRVRGKQCADETCFSSFALNAEDTDPFELGDSTWEWQEHEKYQTLDPSMVQSYGYGGYSTVLPSHDTHGAREKIRALRTMGWIGGATRAVFADLTFFKKNTKRFITCHLLFEISPSGELLYTLELVSIELWSAEKSLLAAGLAFCLCVLVFDEVNDFRRNIPKWRAELGDVLERERSAWVRKCAGHMMEAWNAADFAIIWLLLLALDNMWHLYWMSEVTGGMEREHRDDEFVSFSGLSAYTQTLRDVLGILVVLSWAKILKYIALLPVAGPAVNAIISTVINTSTLTFMMLFVVISVSLSLGLHFTLGNKIEQFSSPTGAGLSFFRMVFGDFEVASFTAHTSVVGELLFVTCLVTANFMLMNILIAVVGVQYERQLRLCSKQWEQDMVTHLQHQLGAPPPHLHYVLHKDVVDTACRKEPTLSSIENAMQQSVRRGSSNSNGGVLTPAGRLQSEWTGMHNKLWSGTKLNSWHDFDAASSR